MHQGWIRSARRLAGALLVAVACALPVLVSAHDIPNDVTIQSFVKAEGQQLQLLVRVPIAAMRDMTWPMKDPDDLDLSKAERSLHDAATLWVGDDVKVYEGNTLLGPQQVIAVRATPTDDRSFENYESAIALLTTPQRTADVATKTGYLDIFFAYPIQSASSRFSIDPQWARLGVRTITVTRLVLPDGTIRAFELEGNPGLIRLDPRWFQAAWGFVKLGFRHILDGTDHLLFLFCLVIPFRRFRSLVTIVTAFTIAHSITLIASAYNLGPDGLWFPPLIEALIATSIVYMALENIAGAKLHRRWLITFGFGLVHGFGFSFALKQTLQFAGSHLLTSLLSFNVGVELGQLLVLLLMIPALDLLFRYAVAERMGTIILSAIVAHTGWHWMMDRFAAFRQYDLSLPEFTPAFVAELLRYAMALVALAGVLWLVSLFANRGKTGGAPTEDAEALHGAHGVVEYETK
jgi:hypothetical protein